MFSFFGNNQSAISHPTGGLPCFTFTLYCPYDEYESTPAEGMRAALENGAVLAKLFSHLATDSQITDFLYAFQELRQPRAQTVLTSETGVIHYMGMPNGPEQEARDQAMQAKHKAGGYLFSGDDESAEWAEIKTVFGYDAEDEADNWWVTWGRLKARSVRKSIP
ncbi:hypothetical protein R3P38DRAFT_3453042 [Favolaschia claudopus]|uniref:Uncharacterized protein n=1 Tax=Favolaschia claudopus TaxID=2862362 RepID=A0AAW0CQN2_9AGAR